MISQKIEAEIDRLAQAYVSKRKNAALAIGGMQQGHSFFRGFGKISPTNPVPPDPQTIYEIGSITKVFTGLVLANLINDGIVDLDDSIRLYLPSAVARSLPAVVQTITLRQLATHTSGLPRFSDWLSSDRSDPANPYKNYTASDLYADLATVKLLSSPGQKHEYSNLGMGLLGHLLSLKTAQPYEDLVKKLVCEPLWMSDTTIHLTPQQQKRLVLGHSANGSLTSNWDFDVLAPAGAFRSTLADLLTFIQANLNETETPMTAMFQRSHQPSFKVNNSFSLGLAWHILTLPKNDLYCHSGGTGGYKSFLVFEQATQTGVVILSNYGDAIVNDESLDEMAIAILVLLAQT